MWTALATVYEGLGRLSDAIAAHTRALLGADRQQTPQILTKLANLHTTLDASRGRASAEGTGYHRKLLALGAKDGREVEELAASYIAVAEWEMRAGSASGDWALAATYLEKVAQSNALQRDKAEELIRELRMREARA